MYIIIVGCGRVGAELAKILSSEGHNVVVIDKNPQSFSRLGAGFNGVTLVGNGFDPELLKSAGIEKADAFCAVTNGDNTNIMSSQVAKKMFNVPKVIARVYDPQRADIYKTLGLDVISGTILVAAMVRDRIIESRFSSYLIETGELGVMEIDISDKFKGKAVGELNIAGEFIVTTVVKKKTQIIIPEAKTILEKGDKIMAVVKTASLSKVRKIFDL
ncbi:MAG TPA: TrkA family potassium uptake protein [Candidatus Omnitrophota bacterium]|nr:TrkA family potassium uptake protein [Candidatus Omnitrophota bacterium]